MKTAKFYAAGIVLLLLFAACNHKENKAAIEAQKIETGQGSASNGNKVEEKVAYTADSTVTPEPTKNNPSKTQTANIDWDKKIIKTANVTMELKDYNNYNKNIHNSIKRFGAYIAGEEQTQSSSTIENNITIKVPVEQFEDLMNSFSGDGIKVLEKKITTEDVTAEVVDTKGRVEAKKEVRQQYLALLKQAKTMKDILEVQNEINTITEELESASGRVKYLTHQAAYSTIHLKYFQYLNADSKPDEESGFFSKIKEAFISGATGIGSFIIGLIGVWPLLILIVAVIAGIRKWNSNKI
jgi:hypothetical protein